MFFLSGNHLKNRVIRVNFFFFFLELHISVPGPILQSPVTLPVSRKEDTRHFLFTAVIPQLPTVTFTLTQTSWHMQLPCLRHPDSSWDGSMLSVPHGQRPHPTERGKFSQAEDLKKGSKATSLLWPGSTTASSSAHSWWGGNCASVQVGSAHQMWALPHQAAGYSAPKLTDELVPEAW